MALVEFLKKEDGAVSVDWAVLAAVTTAMCLAAAGVLTGAINGFTTVQERELAIQNNHGAWHSDGTAYTPESDALYAAYINGLSGLSLAELDALGAFANRLQTVGYGEEETAEETEACNAGNGAGYGVGYCNGFGNDVASVNDFLMAVDQEFHSRGVGRPAHTHIDGSMVGSAFETMGMSQVEVRALLAS